MRKTTIARRDTWQKIKELTRKGALDTVMAPGDIIFDVANNESYEFVYIGPTTESKRGSVFMIKGPAIELDKVLGFPDVNAYLSGGYFFSLPDKLIEVVSYRKLEYESILPENRSSENLMWIPSIDDVKNADGMLHVLCESGFRTGVFGTASGFVMLRANKSRTGGIYRLDNFSLETFPYTETIFLPVCFVIA